MNTPSNAGKEHNPDGLTPEQYDSKHYRMLRIGESVDYGDQWWDYREKNWLIVHKPNFQVDEKCAGFRRRTTPPTREGKECDVCGFSLPRCGCTSTTPPQSQEGEKSAREFVGDWLWESEDRQTSGKPWGSQYIRDAAKMAELYAESKLTTAQRENDRLRSEVEGLKADRERLDWLENPLRFTLEQSVELRVLNPDDKGNYFEFSIREVMPLDEFYACLTLRSAIDAARAATEEGK